MSRQQNCYIYVIAFDSGTLKAGRAADVIARLRTHRREAARHGVGVTAEWYSAPCGEHAAVRYEQRLLDFCASRGTLRAGQEYFSGLDFEEVRAPIENPPPPPTEPPPVWEHKAWRDTALTGTITCRYCLGARVVTHFSEEPRTLITSACPACA